MPISTVPLQAVLGARVRAHREMLDMTQRELADSARDLGWKASRPVIAGVEAGRYRIDLEKLIVLAVALGQPLAGFVGDEDGLVEYFPGAAIQASALRNLLSGGEIDVSDLAGGGRDELVGKFVTASHTLSWQVQPTIQEIEAVWRHAPAQIVNRALEDARDESVQSIGRKLGLTAFQAALLARRQWKCSLIEHRDELAGPDAGPTARGHVTRRLIKELQDVQAR